MLEYEEALAQILAAIPAAQPERVSLAEAHGRVLTERVLAPLHLPPFDNSAMDGYAVRAADVEGAKPDAPKSLRLLGRAAAGEHFAGAIKSGGCVRVFTGSPLPPGADAVVMQEDTRTDPAQPDTVSFLDSAKPWENVRLRGEDVKPGAVVAEPGQELTAGRVSLLAALGLAEIGVGKIPVAGLLATGSELVEPGAPLAPGSIYESNRVALAALLERPVAITKIYPPVKDTPQETARALSRAFDECNVVVTSGGVSVGELDYVKSAFSELGGGLEFWKVSMRPGRPFVFGRWRGKFLFGLPGNPVSAFVTCVLLVRPALRRWQGAADAGWPIQSGSLVEPLANTGGRRHFMRVEIDAAGRVRGAGAQASHLLSSLAAANGLVDVPPNTTLASGTVVRVLRWE